MRKKNVDSVEGSKGDWSALRVRLVVTRASVGYVEAGGP